MGDRKAFFSSERNFIFYLTPKHIVCVTQCNTEPSVPHGPRECPAEVFSLKLCLFQGGTAIL